MKKLLFIATIIIFSSCHQKVKKDLTVQEIWANYIKTCGDTNKLKEVKTYKAKMFYTNKIGAFEQDIYIKYPNKLLLVDKFNDNSKIYKLNGTKAVEISKDSIRTLSKEETDVLYKVCDLFAELKYVDKGYKFELAGTEKVDTIETYKVKITTNEKEIYYYYINVNTFYIVKLEAKDEASYYSNYKIIDGFLCSLNSKFVSKNGELKTEKKDIEYNAEIDDSFFEIDK